MTKFEIHQFICRTDNYGVLVSDADTGLTMSVDAPDAKRIDEELEKRIETLEKEVQHLKAVLQYQMRNKKK